MWVNLKEGARRAARAGWAAVVVMGLELTRGTGFAPLPVSLQSRLAARFMLVKAKDGRSPDYLTTR